MDDARGSELDAPAWIQVLEVRPVVLPQPGDVPLDHRQSGPVQQCVMNLVRPLCAD